MTDRLLWTQIRILAVGAIFAYVPGCQMMRTAFTGSTFEDHQRQLVGRHYPEANRVLGTHLPVWTDGPGGERYLRYAVPGGNRDEFYLTRVSDRDVILTLSHWRASGGEFDAAETLPDTKRPLIGSKRNGTTMEVGLTTPIITFVDLTNSGMEIDVHPSDGDLWGWQRALMVECDNQGIRRRARYFSVEGDLPTQSKVTKAATPTRPTLASRIDLFGEEPMPQKTSVQQAE